MTCVFPKPLKQNSTIGLICPASGFKSYEDVKTVINYLKNLGFKVVLGKAILSKNNHYLSGPDDKRADDLNNFISDKNINAIFCLRGGYGSLRILEHINFNLLKDNPKIILGFSDITVLLLSILTKCNLITFHGPVLGYKFIRNNLKPYNKESETKLWSLLTNKSFTFSYTSDCYVIKKGKAYGKLLGGNLTDICSMLGSKYLPSFKNSILFLEDCYEEPYKIDRMLTQLMLAGVFNEVKALIVSDFYKCKFKHNQHIGKLLSDKFKGYNFPVIYGFPLGHSQKNYVLPIGANVIFDSQKRLLKSLI